MPSYKMIATNSRQEWLRERKKVLTATEIARLHGASPSVWEGLRLSKSEEPREIDSMYLSWGRKREPEICKYVLTFVDSTLEPNDQLLVSTRNPRIGATPDMLGDEVIGEIKTSRFPMPDLSQGLKLSGMALSYFIQVQVQLFVTGADACVFTWERHDNLWVEVGEKYPEPKPLDINHQIVYPDCEVFDLIERIVSQFDEGELDSNSRVSQLVQEHHEINKKLKKLEKRKSNVREELEKLVDVGERIVTAHGAVSYSQGKSRHVFDSKAFKESYPDLYSNFVVEKESKPNLRVNPFEEEK